MVGKRLCLTLEIERMKDSKVLIVIPTVQIHQWNLMKTLYTLLKNTRDFEYDLLLVKNNFRGFAKAVNKGLKIVKDNKVYGGCVLLNDDVIINDKIWLDRLIKAPGDIIGCQGALKICYIPFWCVYIKRKVIEKIGLLDEQFLIGEWEDTDYCIRAIEAGFKVRESSCKIEHKVGGTLNRLDLKKKLLIQKNRQLFLKKYKSTKWAVIFKEENY